MKRLEQGFRLVEVASDAGLLGARCGPSAVAGSTRDHGCRRAEVRLSVMAGHRDRPQSRCRQSSHWPQPLLDQISVHDVTYLPSARWDDRRASRQQLADAEGLLVSSHVKVDREVIACGTEAPGDQHHERRVRSHRRRRGA